MHAMRIGDQFQIAGRRDHVKMEATVDLAELSRLQRRATS